MTKERIQKEIQDLTNQKAQTLLTLRDIEDQVLRGKKILDGLDCTLMVLGKLLKEEEESESKAENG